MATTDLEWLTRMVAERSAGLAIYARQWLDAASAEDVVQEALVSLLSRYGGAGSGDPRTTQPGDPRTSQPGDPRTTQPPKNPTAWMYRAVRNAAIGAARSRSRRRRREQTVAATRREWFDVRPDALVDAKLAEEALKRLSVDQREVVVLRIWGELGFAEIADVMQLAVSTVHDRYGKALSELRRELEKPCKTKTD